MLRSVTNMATPHVTGTVALLLSMYPSLTPQEVRTILECSALHFEWAPPSLYAVP